MTEIVSHCEQPELFKCSQASHQLFAIANPRMYRKVHLDYERKAKKPKNNFKRVFLGARLPPIATEETVAGENVDETPIVDHSYYGYPSSPNQDLKTSLLAKVQHLVIGPHHKRDCKPFLDMAATWLPNVQVLELIPRKLGDGRCRHGLCQATKSMCPIIKSFNPTHIIFRNLVHEGLVIPRSVDYSPSNLQHITYYMSKNGVFYRTQTTDLRRDIRAFNANANQVEFIFEQDESYPYLMRPVKCELKKECCVWGRGENGYSDNGRYTRKSELGWEGNQEYSPIPLKRLVRLFGKIMVSTTTRYEIKIDNPVLVTNDEQALLDWGPVLEDKLSAMLAKRKTIFGPANLSITHSSPIDEDPTACVFDEVPANNGNWNTEQINESIDLWREIVGEETAKLKLPNRYYW